MRAMRSVLLVALPLFVLGCSSVGPSRPDTSTPRTLADRWVIGPVVKGKNYSIGMPPHPTMQGAGWFFDFPKPGGKVDYVQNFDPPPLVGARKITLRYAVTGGGFTPDDQDGRARVGLQFQRKGDDWTAKGAMQSYRWYSLERPALSPGEFTLTVALEPGSWGNVHGSSTDAAGFAAALRELDNIAVVFGSDGAAGHGVYATKASRFTLVELTVE
jgi:hypothetical protein